MAFLKLQLVFVFCRNVCFDSLSGLPIVHANAGSETSLETQLTACPLLWLARLPLYNTTAIMSAAQAPQDLPRLGGYTRFELELEVRSLPPFPL